MGRLHRSLSPGVFAAASALAVGSVCLPSQASEGIVETDWWTVRAALEEHCLDCHGGTKRASGLSFATADTFELGGDRGSVVDRTDLSKSRILSVISYRDPNLAMPPSAQLPDNVAQVLREWVLAGAAWPGDDAGRLADPAVHPIESHTVKDDGSWWAYQPLDPGDVPTVSDPSWSEHAIDAFVHSGLTERGLEPVGLAPPRALLRRATFDLTGLPPTPDEIDEFVRAYGADPDAAWSALIDRLLSAPAYGEHWARHWLDQVRYAETNGYERDGTKTNIWRYRDWVIRAFNDDMPYDEFVMEQLAGDELAQSRGASRSSAILATGFYRLGVWDDEPADAPQARADELADIVNTTGQIFLGMTVGCARCHDHKADPISQRDYFAMTAYFNNVTGFGGGGYGQHLGGGMTRPLADAPTPGQMTMQERNRRMAELREELKALFADEQVGSAPQEVLVADARKGGTEWRYREGPPPADVRLQGFNDSSWTIGKSGFGTKGTPGALVGTTWSSPAISIRTRFRLTSIPDGAILSIHHDEDADVYLNGVKIASMQGYRGGYTDLQLGPDALHAFVIGSNALAVTCRQTGGGQFIDVGLRTGWLDPFEAWVARVDGAEDSSDERIVAARKLMDAMNRLESMPVAEPYPALVVSERGARAPDQYVHLRGSVHAEGDKVEPGIPSVLSWAGEPTLPSVEANAPTTGRRLAFAKWLVRDGNFLSARVAANRLWQFHFGRGICRTSGDFGRLGQMPTHPKLLDHLAQRLIANEWSMKAMHREIMMSRLYRTSSVPSETLLARDPRNDWYGRVDPQRLTAEQYRDAVLSVSGEINSEMYGPSVYPPLPAEVLATASRPNAAWGRSSKADAVRRSVYVFSKRSLRPPLFENLDQPSPDLPCPVRFPTNVPTQALITLNGDFVNGAAASFAERLQRETTDDPSLVERGILLALGRVPDDAEVARHLAFLTSLQEREELDHNDAIRVYCLMLLNLNEFLWVD